MTVELRISEAELRERMVRIQLAPSNKHALAYCTTDGCTFAGMRE